MSVSSTDMKLAVAGFVASSLFACGGAPARDSPPGGCPPAGAIAFAQWNPRTITGSPEWQGQPKDAVWLVRLGFRPGDAVDAPAPGAMQGYEVAKLGLGPLPDQVWLLRAGVATCAARVTGYVAERVDETGVPQLRISAVLSGCATSSADDDAWQPAWVSLAGVEPIGCSVVAPAPAGERTGTSDGEDRFTIAPLTDATALPAAWTLAGPTEACPGCERLWSISTTPSEPAVSVVTVSDVVPGDGDACSLEHRDAYGFYVTVAGAAPTRLPLEVDFLDLAGVLVDSLGTRVVLAVGPDTWVAHDLLGDGTLGNGRTVQYYQAHPESGMWHAMTPYCGP